MTDDADAFAALGEMDEERIAEARARDDEWGAMVRVAHDVARGKQPDRADCEALGLPYSDDGYEDVMTTPGGASTPPKPTKRQVRPLVRYVVDVLEKVEAT